MTMRAKFKKLPKIGNNHAHKLKSDATILFANDQDDYFQRFS